jgi:hypothetical protein
VVANGIMQNWRNLLFCAVANGTGAAEGAYPSLAVAVKGLRSAAMNAQRTCALDRRPRCGC